MHCIHQDMPITYRKDWCEEMYCIKDCQGIVIILVLEDRGLAVENQGEPNKK